MMSRILNAFILMIMMAIPVSASDYYLLIARGDICSMSGFDGRFWGADAGKVVLSGGKEQMIWLDERGINYDAVAIDDELSNLYLFYPGHRELSGLRTGVVYSRDGLVISTIPPDTDIPYRKLQQRQARFAEPNRQPDLILDYDPLIDEMIGQVSSDGIYEFLSGLSGATPVEVDGQQDTIHTRYSGAPDNTLAARYLRETLENYGYQSEFHGFYGGQIRHMASYSDDLAWLVTENSEALRTTDGGQNWVIMPDGTNNSLWGVANIGADMVWLTGDGGVIRYSDNGGESFVPQTSGVGSFLFGLTFIDESNGWIAGDNGRILHTTNGGAYWASQSTSTSSRLYDVCFVDSQNGWACGRDGTVIHTVDGGANWSTQNANTNQRLYGIDFIDNDNGWLVGWSGVVRHTTDGGANWLTVNLGDSVEKYHVDFATADFGSIAGWNGEIFVTTDGGANWEERSTGSESDFYGLTFVDDQTGYAGGNGVLMKTTDGGDNWFSQTQNVESAWRNVIATKPGTVDPDQQVIICGHFDDRSEQSETYAPGADDNGSGSVAVVEAARIFAQYDFEKTIKFCLWTGEEQGLLGSAAYAAEAFAREDDITGVYNFDMIAWDGNGDASVEFHTGTSGPSIELGNMLSEVVSDYSIALDPDIITYGATGASDHASFWDYGYAAMLGIEDYSSDFNPYYHSTGDNINHIDLGLFYEFTKAAVGAAATLAVPDTSSTEIVEGHAQPGQYMLRGSYPNPFNAATTISFSIPVETEINLAVYDILGRKVAILYSGRVEAGTHNVTWNAGERPSGVYFYRLTTGAEEAVGRMTLLK